MGKKEPLTERMERWVDYAQWQGLKLTRVLIHPDDASAAPRTFRGLPVVVMSTRRL